MKPADFMRELVYPLTDMAIVMAMFFFWVIFTVAKLVASTIPLIGVVLAIMLLIVLAPAYFRYLLYLLEARANEQQAPVPTGEMFGPADNFWSLTPLVLVVLLIWGGIYMSSYGSVWVLLYGTIFLLVAPASLGILAITHSPVESLNPAAIVRMIRTCGLSYLLIPVIVVVLAFLLVLLDSTGAPNFVIEIGTSYQVVLMFTLTGGVLRTKGVAFDLSIEPSLEASVDEIAGDLQKEREKVASHAYGFISRGNREGGFAHIMDWIEEEPDVHEASAWFFNAMMRWESKDAALFYAQIYIAHLLHHDEDTKVLKLLSVCLHENPRWKPKSEDRQHVLDLAEKYRRDDLLKSLRN